MNNFLSVIHLLKRFGIYIYTGNRIDDIELMIEEIQELYENHLIMKEDYLKAIMLLREERRKSK